MHLKPRPCAPHLQQQVVLPHGCDLAMHRPDAAISDQRVPSSVQDLAAKKEVTAEGERCGGAHVAAI